MSPDIPTHEAELRERLAREIEELPRATWEFDAHGEQKLLEGGEQTVEIGDVLRVVRGG